jgi:mitochondrial import receptor subunit TOM40
MHGGIDHEGNLNARLNQGWSANNITKMQMQVRDFLPFSVR